MQQHRIYLKNSAAATTNYEMDAKQTNSERSSREIDNNRPSSSMQMKLQEVVTQAIHKEPVKFFEQDNYSRKATLKARVDVTQLAKSTELQKNKLNVVGELHKESDKRRLEEKRIGLNELKTHLYWEEPEFKIPSLFGEGKYGDNKKLRLTHFLAKLKDEWSVIGNISPEKFDEMKLSGTWGDRMDELLTYTSGAYLESPETGKTKEHLKYLLSDLRTLEKDADYENYKSVKTAMVQLEAYSAQYKNTPAEPDNYRKKRSDHMHDVANDTANRFAGIWKVGDKHITDFENDKVENQYAYMSRDDFNARYFKQGDNNTNGNRDKLQDS